MLEESGIYYKHKYDFLIRNFPFLDPNKFIFTGGKNIFKADVQIDDRLKNMEGEIDIKLLYSAYHNKNITEEELKRKNVIRVENWQQIKEILLNN